MWSERVDKTIVMNSKEYATPYFVIEKDILDNGLNQLKHALESTWGNFEIGYSYKTNTLPWVVDYFMENGCLSEVVSDDEYYLAKSRGAGRLIYNGVAKSKETFLEAVEEQSIVNIDAEYEIDWLDELEEKENCEVGIRVNFDLESMCPGQTQCGADGERFGFCYENGELKKAIDRITEKGVRLAGLHLHKSSKTRMPEIYRAIAEIVVKIAGEYDLDLKYVDIGGGFFGGLPTKPQFIEYFDMVSSILKKKFKPQCTQLIVEPGMALIGAAVSFVTTVKDVKRTLAATIAITDGSRTNIDPLMTKSSYFDEIVRSDAGKREIIERQIISGFTCMEHDRLFEVHNGEELLPGDKIIYHKVGAYTMCLSPLFIKWFPDVYVRTGESCKLVRSRWKTPEFTSNSTGEI